MASSRPLCFMLLMLLACSTSLAVRVSLPRRASYSSLDPTFHVDFHFYAGSARLSTESWTDGPALGEFSLGLNLGWFILSPAFIYGSADYSFINQYQSTSAGNYQGTRQPKTGVGLGFKLGDYYLMGEYQLSGNYKLSKQSTTSQSLIFKKPSGYRVSVLFPWDENTKIAIFYEASSFQKVDISGAEFELTSAMKLNSFGLAAVYVF